ncbi:MAG: 5'/3'-nucleotidase SurE [Porphyromonadaceae bacterium]|nr:MAG: 5'/3'-nucleotidase SurE [Porphyromonadaceae bacterium]
MIKKPLILVCNDDGYRARGIQELSQLAVEFGEVVVVAPVFGQSGMSHAVTLNHPIRLKSSSMNNGFSAFACSGTPADCIKIALNQILDRKPDLVLSGINHGSNASVSLFYSGTVAATIEACMNGIPSVAFSVDDHSPDADFRLAIQYARPIIQKVLVAGLPLGTCLNVNFPRISPEQCKGIKVCRQTIGVWKEEFDKRTDPQGHDYFWLTGEFSNDEPLAEDTDEWALKHNYGAIVPVSVDVTDYPAMEALKLWVF